MLSLALCSGPAGGNCGALGLKRHSPGKRTGRNHASARDVWVGSKREELNVSKSSPLCLGELTSKRRAATSLVGQQRSFRNRVDECCPHREARRRGEWSEHKRRKPFEEPRPYFFGALA